MARLRDLHLVLFMTPGVSLATWARLGTLEREIALYARCLPRLAGVSFVSHGGREDLRHAARLGGIRLVCNRLGLPARAWQAWLAEGWARLRRPPAVFKTNQIAGGELASRAARRAGAALVARCGWLPSLNAARLHGEGSAQERAALASERELLPRARRVVVPSQALRERVALSHGLDPARIRVVPNAVDTGLFRPPAAPVPAARRVCYAGRLDERDKNLKALVEAVAGLDVDLWLVGSGPSQEDLRRQAEACGARVRFLGTRHNAELPAIFAECAAFVLPSRVEGHPKALIEAMACGRAVVGSDVPGIRDVIVPRETGLLCGTSPESIRAALRELLADAALRARLGAAARAWALAHVSLERAVEAELDLLSELALELT